jgi:alpha-amylase
VSVLLNLTHKYLTAFFSQRGHGAGGDWILSYQNKNLFTKASVFMLAHPHGGDHPRLMSSYFFDDPSQGPPQSSCGNIISRGIDANGACTNGWVCEHRWAPIANMIKFRAETNGELVRSFTNIAEDQISFCRGKKGFVAINNSAETLNATVTACVPDGFYCDVISGDVLNGQCTGKSVVVSNGKTRVELTSSPDGVLAIHTAARPDVLWQR